MKRFLFPWLFVFAASSVYAQVVLRPPNSCTETDLYYCDLFSLDPCPCGSAEIGRTVPVQRMDIPRRIGVVALAKDGGYNGLWHNLSGYPNWVAADEVVGYGISAIHLWPMVSLTDEPGWWPLPDGDDYRDMTWVFENPGIDLVVVRPMQHSFSELACDGVRAAVWEGGDWGAYAEDLLRKFGNVKKTVILLNWEGDWQLWGARCREPNECPTGDVWPSRQHEEYVACSGQYDCQKAVCDEVREGRAWYLRKLFEERQAGIEAARAAHPDAALTVLHGVTVNHTSDTEQINLTRDVIPFLEHQPDVIALSHWDKTQSITEALYYIRDNTHHARYNTIVIEIGAKKGDDQGDKIYELASAALNWGVQAVFVWTWKDAQYGVVDENGVAESGMEGIQRLISEYEHGAN